MKAFLIAAAAACGVALAAPASAQMTAHTTTTTVKQTSVERHSNNGRWHGPRWVKKKVCKTVWRNHHKVRRCTWQRVRVR